MKICKRCIVTGRVQGVAYRAATQQQAQALNLTGYAKNLADGSVEVLACGAEHDINELCAWLWEGPRLAQVNDVQCSGVTDQGFTGIRRTVGQGVTSRYFVLFNIMDGKQRQ